MCPKGDDPLTTGQLSRTINVAFASTDDTSNLAGVVRMSFLGYTATFNATPTALTETYLETIFEAMESLSDVTVTMNSNTASSGNFNLAIEAFPRTPVQNTFHVHDGSPSKNLFTCDASGVTGGTSVTCTITDVIISGVKGSVLDLLLPLPFGQLFFNRTHFLRHRV